MRALPAKAHCIPPAFLILFGIGAAWVCATEPVSVDQADELGKRSALSKDDRKPEQKKFKFTVAGEKWDVVFRWLKEETGKPVIAELKPPGICEILVPEGASYTLPQTIDLINQALIVQKHRLIQRENAFTLVPADEKIEEMAVQVDLKDLDEYGQTEVVRVMLRVKGVDVEDLLPTVQRMLSEFGDVITLRRCNRLVLTDTVATIKLIERALSEIPGDRSDMHFSK